MYHVAMPNQDVALRHRDFLRGGKTVKVRIKAGMPRIFRIRPMGNKPPQMRSRAELQTSVALSAIRQRNPNTNRFGIIVCPQSLVLVQRDLAANNAWFQKCCLEDNRRLASDE